MNESITNIKQLFIRTYRWHIIVIQMARNIVHFSHFLLSRKRQTLASWNEYACAKKNCHANFYSKNLCLHKANHSGPTFWLCKNIFPLKLINYYQLKFSSIKLFRKYQPNSVAFERLGQNTDFSRDLAEYYGIICHVRFHPAPSCLSFTLFSRFWCRFLKLAGL